MKPIQEGIPSLCIISSGCRMRKVQDFCTQIKYFMNMSGIS